MSSSRSGLSTCLLPVERQPSTSAFHAVARGMKIKYFLLFYFCLAAMLCVPDRAFSFPAEADRSAVQEKASTQSPADSLHVREADSLRDSKEGGLESIPGSRSSEPFDFSRHQKNSGISLIWVISAILIVFALLILFLHFLRKFVYRPLGGFASRGQFELLRQFHLGPKKSIALVKIFNRLFILGVTETSITTLSEIHDPQEVAEIESKFADPKKAQNPNFREIYQGFLSRVKK